MNEKLKKVIRKKVARVRAKIARKQPKPSKQEKKRVIRLKMLNLSYLSHHPDRRLTKIAECNGDYFPPEILAIEDEMQRKQAKKLYMELAAGLKLQKRYRRNNLQHDKFMLKLSKILGIFPKDYVRKDSETKEWERNWEERRRLRLERSRRAKAALNAKKPVRPPYTVTLAKECSAAGVELVKPKRPRLSQVGEVRAVFNIPVKKSARSKKVQLVRTETVCE